MKYFVEYWRAARSIPLVVLFIGLVLPLALFGKIADSVREGHTLARDDAILNALHIHASSRLDVFFVTVAHWGGFYGLLPASIVLVGWLWILKRRGDALFLFSSVVGACLINLVAKQIFGRHRPALWLSPAPQSDFGFPSGHAMLSTAFFFALVILVWKTRWRFPVLVLSVFSVALICLSRLYLGVHYPTDIAGGILASMGWTNGVHWLRRARHRPWRDNFALKTFVKTASTVPRQTR